MCRLGLRGDNLVRLFCSLVPEGRLQSLWMPPFPCPVARMPPTTVFSTSKNIPPYVLVKFNNRLDSFTKPSGWVTKRPKGPSAGYRDTVNRANMHLACLYPLNFTILYIRRSYNGCSADDVPLEHPYTDSGGLPRVLRTSNSREGAQSRALDDLSRLIPYMGG